MIDYVFGRRSAQRSVLTATGANKENPVDSTATELKKYLNTDAVLSSNMREIQFGIFEKPMEIKRQIGKEVSEDKVSKYNKQLDNSAFYSRTMDALPALIWNGNAFFEVDIVSGVLKGVYNIDPERMKPVTDDTGEVIEWRHRAAQKEIVIPKERIIHLRMPSLNSDLLAQSFLLPLQYTLDRKRIAENYLAGMIENLNPIIFLKFIQTAPPEELDKLKNELRASRGPIDPFKILALDSQDEIGYIQAGTTQGFQDVQSYINTLNDEIIRVLHVPPIVAGTVDNSNRSNSEIQERAVFGRTVNFFQNLLLKQLNKQLIQDRLGWKDVELTFPLRDDREKETVIVRAQKLKELGYSNDVIHKYMQENGFDLENDFVEPEQVEGITKDIDDMESRRPRDKGGVPQNEEERVNSRANGTEVKTNG